MSRIYKQQTNKQTPWPLVRERTIPTERPPLMWWQIPRCYFSSGNKTISPCPESNRTVYVANWKAVQRRSERHLVSSGACEAGYVQLVMRTTPRRPCQFRHLSRSQIHSCVRMGSSLKIPALNRLIIDRRAHLLQAAAWWRLMPQECATAALARRLLYFTRSLESLFIQERQECFHRPDMTRSKPLQRNTRAQERANESCH
jgi:hypothetical protein